MLGLKQSIQGIFESTPLEGLIPGPPALLLVLPATALALGLALISFWVRKTSRALDDEKRRKGLEAFGAIKKSN